MKVLRDRSFHFQRADLAPTRHAVSVLGVYQDG
jgi:hypothetical protein